MERARKTILVGVLTLFIATLTPGDAMGQGAAEGGWKIAVVDFKQILAEFDKRENKYKELENYVKDKQAILDNMENTIKKDRENYGKMEAGQAKQDLEQKINGAQVDYQAALKKLQDEIDSREQEVLRTCLTDIRDALQKIGDKDKYHLILDAKNPGGGGVLYASTTLDITSTVLDFLNKNYK